MWAISNSFRKRINFFTNLLKYLHLLQITTLFQYKVILGFLGRIRHRHTSMKKELFLQKNLEVGILDSALFAYLE